MKFFEGDPYMDALDAELDEIIANAKKASASSQPSIAKQVMKDAGKPVTPASSIVWQYKNGAPTSSGKILKALGANRAPRYVAQIRKDTGISLTAFHRAVIDMIAGGFVSVASTPGKLDKLIITDKGLNALKSGASSTATDVPAPKSSPAQPKAAPSVPPAASLSIDAMGVVEAARKDHHVILKRTTKIDDHEKIVRVLEEHKIKDGGYTLSYEYDSTGKLVYAISSDTLHKAVASDWANTAAYCAKFGYGLEAIVHLD